MLPVSKLMKKCGDETKQPFFFYKCNQSTYLCYKIKRYILVFSFRLPFAVFACGSSLKDSVLLQTSR